MSGVGEGQADLIQQSQRTEKRYRAIFWDNDGVLVDTERLYHQASREVLAELGVDLSPRLYFDYFLASSRGMAALLAKRELGDRSIALIREKRDRRYAELLATEPITRPGVSEALGGLRRQRFTMGIVTSSRREHFDAIHRRAGLLDHFDFVLTQDDYPETKPAPDPYLAAVRRCGLAAADCLAIEDAPRGLASAKAAGIDCWVIRTNLTSFADFSAADRVLESVAEVAALLKNGPSTEGDGNLLAT